MPNSDLDRVPLHSTENSTPITLTIENKVIPAILYNRATAKELLAKLPHKVRLGRGPVDYCGGMGFNIKYTKQEAQDGFRNGELAYWIPGGDFVIFIDKEEESLSVSQDCIMIGKLTKPADLEIIKKMKGSIEVLIQPAK